MSDDNVAGAPLPARTNHPYDAPDAQSLILAVRDYLADELMVRTEGPDRWLLRISSNALTIAAQEVELGAAHRRAHEDRLHDLGVASDAELAQLIRSGGLDQRWQEVREAIAASVGDSLAVANPGYVARGR